MIDGNIYIYYCSKILNYLRLIVCLAGIIPAIPPLGEIGGIVFGFGQIVWLPGEGSICSGIPEKLEEILIYPLM